MRLWEYFEQEARKSKVSRDEEEWNLEARPLNQFQLRDEIPSCVSAEC